MFGKLKTRLTDYASGCEGQTLTEYAFILVLVAMVVIIMVMAFGGTVNNTYSTINSAMP